MNTTYKNNSTGKTVTLCKNHDNHRRATVEVGRIDTQTAQVPGRCDYCAVDVPTNIDRLRDQMVDALNAYDGDDYWGDVVQAGAYDDIVDWDASYALDYGDDTVMLVDGDAVTTERGEWV